MAEVIKLLPFSEDISAALVQRKGELGRYLNLVESYERGDWKSVTESASVLCIVEEKIPGLYLDACRWANLLPA